MYASFVEYSETGVFELFCQVGCCFGGVWTPVWVMEKIL
jgi:hypothetical protein